MRRLTWEEAEAIFPECSAAVERDNMHDEIGNTSAWELVELQSYTSTTGLDTNGKRVTFGVAGTSLWIVVGDEYRAKYDTSANPSLPGGRWMLFCSPKPAKTKEHPHNVNVSAVGRGHPSIGTIGMSNAFIATCSCGYLSAYYSTLQHAGIDADQHRRSFPPPSPVTSSQDQQL